MPARTATRKWNLEKLQRVLWLPHVVSYLVSSYPASSSCCWSLGYRIPDTEVRFEIGSVVEEYVRRYVQTYVRTLESLIFSKTPSFQAEFQVRLSLHNNVLKRWSSFDWVWASKSLSSRLGITWLSFWKLLNAELHWRIFFKNTLHPILPDPISTLPQIPHKTGQQSIIKIKTKTRSII